VSSYSLGNVGAVEPMEFKKAIEKIGVTIPTERDLKMLYDYYDVDGNGSLNYKEFSAILLGKDAPGSERKSQQFGTGLGYKNHMS